VFIGTDPLEKPLDEADHQASRINTTLADIKGYGLDDLGINCYDETEVALNSAAQMFSEIIDIVSYAQCEHLNIVWRGLIEDGFCDQVFSGLYVFWVSQFTAAACLYVLIVLSAIVYPDYKGRFLRTACWCFYSSATPVLQDDPDKAGDNAEEGRGNGAGAGAGTIGEREARSSADYEMVQLGNVEEGRSSPGSTGTKTETAEGVVSGVAVDGSDGNGSIVYDDVQRYHSIAEGGAVVGSTTSDSALVVSEPPCDENTAAL
jgi:hypothetical protein